MLGLKSCLVFSVLFASIGSELAAQSKAPKVLIIGIDGLRPDAMMKADTPNIDALMADGGYSLEARTSRITVSGPGWSSMLTGVWLPKHNVPDNDFRRPAYDRYPHFFTRLREQKPEAITAAFNSWEPLSKFLVPPAHTSHAVFINYDDGGDEKLVLLAAGLLANEPLDVVFFYFADVDGAGHNFGFHPDSPEYIAEIEEVDGQLSLLIDAVRSRVTYEQEDWLILVSSDHGGTLDGSHGRDEPKHRKIPYIASGSSAARGIIYPTPNVVDIAVTAMTHLGVTIDPAWNLDGVPSGLPRSLAYDVNLIVNGDAEYALPESDPEVNHGIAGWIDEGAMSTLAYGSNEGYPTSNDHGCAERGSSFFHGVKGSDCMMTQTIDLGSKAGDIDRGACGFEFSGWLGGFAQQRDFASVIAIFRDENGMELGRDSIGPVTLADRQREIGGEGEALTGLLHRQTKGTIPKGCRRVELVLESEVGEGLNDGYADDLSFLLVRIN
ncbi:MAG: alkaline phosphatase family protein [Planctomycetota bacterium]|nr:alkaline phosphatase family protein [Planctomycetota bacterium]